MARRSSRARAPWPSTGAQWDITSHTSPTRVRGYLPGSPMPGPRLPVVPTLRRSESPTRPRHPPRRFGKRNRGRGGDVPSIPSAGIQRPSRPPPPGSSSLNYTAGIGPARKKGRGPGVGRKKAGFYHQAVGAGKTGLALFHEDGGPPRGKRVLSYHDLGAQFAGPFFHRVTRPPNRTFPPPGSLLGHVPRRRFALLSASDLIDSVLDPLGHRAPGGASLR